jgi:tight adherence protein B
MNPIAWAVAAAIGLVIAAPPKQRNRSLVVSTSTPTPPRPVHASHRGVRSTRNARTSDDAAAIARWCEALSRAVRGGTTLTAALRVTDPPPAAASVVAAIVIAVERGGRFEVSDRDVTPHLALALTVIAASLEHGGSAAEPLDRAADVLRSRAAEHAERQVHSAQARLSARVMTALPLAMLMLLVATSDSVRRVTVSPFGAFVVTVGVALNLIGWRWMRATIERAGR